MIVIEWKCPNNGNPIKTRDYLNESDWLSNVKDKRILHKFYSPGEYKYWAVCYLTVEDTKITLKYNQTENDEKLVSMGNMRFDYIKQQNKVENLQWKNKGDKDDDEYIAIKYFKVTLLEKDDIDNEIKEKINRLPPKGNKPQQTEKTETTYSRNQDVIDICLDRAHGKCEDCGNYAPFLRKTDNEPYLEVHHKKPLADGGTDDLANTIALCPNCHRKRHYG